MHFRPSAAGCGATPLETLPRQGDSASALCLGKALYVYPASWTSSAFGTAAVHMHLTGASTRVQVALRVCQAKAGRLQSIHFYVMRDEDLAAWLECSREMLQPLPPTPTPQVGAPTLAMVHRVGSCTVRLGSPRTCSG